MHVCKAFRNSFHLTKKSLTQIGSSCHQGDPHDSKSVDRRSCRVGAEGAEIAKSAVQCHDTSGRDLWVVNQAEQRKHIWMAKM